MIIMMTILIYRMQVVVAGVVVSNSVSEVIRLTVFGLSVADFCPVPL